MKRKNILSKQKKDFSFYHHYYHHKINDAIDNPMLFLYPKVEAYVCVPPLVVQPFDLKTSTVQQRSNFLTRLKKKLFKKTMKIDLNFFKDL